MANEALDRANQHARQERVEAILMRARQALRPLQGERVTLGVASVMARLLWLEFPYLKRADVEALAYPEIIRGKVLTAEEIDNRARQLACVVLGGES